MKGPVVTEQLEDGSRTTIRDIDSGEPIARMLSFRGLRRVRIVIEAPLRRSGLTLVCEEAKAWRDALTVVLAEIEDWDDQLLKEAADQGEGDRG